MSGWAKRSTWLGLAIAVAAYILCAGIYFVAIPPFEGFDAQAHFAAIQYYRSEHTLPVLTPTLVEQSYELVPHPPLYYVLSAAAATGWPLQDASELARHSSNAYFDKSLSARQSVTLPGVPWQALAPAQIARLIASIAGMITLLCTWWLARLLMPSAHSFALAAALVATLNPQFLFTAVTISNDAWAAAMAALTLAVAVDAVVRKRAPSAWLWIGAAAGLAALTKVSTLALGLPLGILWLLHLQRQGWRQALRGLGFAAAGFGLVAGWWFARNWLLYGEVVPFNRMAEVLPTMRRPEPYTWQRTLEHVPWLVASFWGVFVAVIAPPWYLDITRWCMLGGLGGMVPAAIRVGRRWPIEQAVLFAVLLPWLGSVAASVLYWTRTIEYGEQGRLAHIGASAFGVVMVAGWQAWFPARWRRWVHGLVASGMLALALALVPFLQVQFGLPPAVAQPVMPDRSLDAHFAGGMRLIGLDLPQGAALERGKALPLTLYFSTDAPIPDDYTLFLHVADSTDRLLYQFDGVPADGRHPSRQWIPGQVFTDTHSIVVDEIAQDGLATLSVGFYPIADPSRRLPVYDGNGQEVGDRLVVAKLRLHSKVETPPMPPVDPVASWRNGITLDTAQLAFNDEGQPTGVTVTWQPLATLQQDYTVFAQVLDANDHLLAQVDSQPQEGTYPTSTWRFGDIITDTLTWSGDLEKWDRVIVGLYGSDGVRLPLVNGRDYSEVGALSE